MVQAVLTGRSTGSGFDLTCLAVYLASASVSSIFVVLYLDNFFVTVCTLRFSEQSLVGLALTVVLLCYDTVGWVI